MLFTNCLLMTTQACLFKNCFHIKLVVKVRFIFFSKSMSGSRNESSQRHLEVCSNSGCVERKTCRKSPCEVDQHNTKCLEWLQNGRPRQRLAGVARHLHCGCQKLINIKQRVVCILHKEHHSQSHHFKHATSSSKPDMLPTSTSDKPIEM